MHLCECICVHRCACICVYILCEEENFKSTYNRDICSLQRTNQKWNTCKVNATGVSTFSSKFTRMMIIDAQGLSNTPIKNTSFSPHMLRIFDIIHWHHNNNVDIVIFNILIESEREYDLWLNEYHRPLYKLNMGHVPAVYSLCSSPHIRLKFDLKQRCFKSTMLITSLSIVTFYSKLYPNVYSNML